MLLLARLLAKFLGFISFLPYRTSETPSREIQEAAVALRSKVEEIFHGRRRMRGGLYVCLNPVSVPQSVQVLDVCALLRDSVKRRRTILTVPWLVEFLSMLDGVGPLLPCYRSALGTLLLLYRCVLHPGEGLGSFLAPLKPDVFDVPCRRMLLGRGGEMCYLNKLLMVSVLGWLFQVSFSLERTLKNTNKQIHFFVFLRV